ncbi:hypothetical protein [Fulvivirga sediminis]|uniref:hypothetical protein n=1 Tax=Fulvivirga sediminis TaxID=2803949 RepID=UPI00192347AB|nr:hypothetical protein [Fulvivirga sediminis]
MTSYKYNKGHLFAHEVIERFTNNFRYSLYRPNNHNNIWAYSKIISNLSGATVIAKLNDFYLLFNTLKIEV